MLSSSSITSPTPEDGTPIEKPVDPQNIEDIENGEDYYLNPLINDTQKLTGDDTLTKMLSSLETEPKTTDEVAEVLGSKDEEGGKSVSYVGDPYQVDGKLVRFGRYFGANIEVSQNASMTGYQDYLEDGRLLAFSIECNDPDMIPVVFVENAVGSKDVINDLSFKEAVMHGRGMSYGEATSTIRMLDGATSRDVSGRLLNHFPSVLVYKDTFTGTETEYDKLKNTLHDKRYVMHFEPTIPIPYKRLYFDVFNNSVNGTRLINRVEIKRLVYIEPNEYQAAKSGDTEFTNFNKVLMQMYEKFNGKPKGVTDGEIPVPTSEEPLPPMVALSGRTRKRRPKASKEAYDDFIRYLYERINDKSVARVDMFNEKAKPLDVNMHVVGKKEQRYLKDLKKKVKGKTEMDDMMAQLKTQDEDYDTGRNKVVTMEFF